MNRPIAALLLALSVATPGLAQDIAEPRSGVKFATKEGDTTLTRSWAPHKDHCKDKGLRHWPLRGGFGTLRFS